MDFQPAIKVSKEEFQEMSAGLLADNGEIDGEHMEAMLMAELAAYAERMLALDIVGVPVRDEHLAAIMFAVCTLLRHQPLSAQAYLSAQRRSAVAGGATPRVNPRVPAKIGARGGQEQPGVRGSAALGVDGGYATDEMDVGEGGDRGIRSLRRQTWISAADSKLAANEPASSSRRTSLSSSPHSIPVATNSKLAANEAQAWPASSNPAAAAAPYSPQRVGHPGGGDAAPGADRFRVCAGKQPSGDPHRVSPTETSRDEGGGLGEGEGQAERRISALEAVLLKQGSGNGSMCVCMRISGG